MAVREEQMEILGYNQEVEEELLEGGKHRNPQNKYHVEIPEGAQEEEALEDILVAHMLVVEAYSLQVDLDVLLVDSLLVGILPVDILPVDILHVDLDTLLVDLDILLVEVNIQAADDDIRHEELADPFVTSAALEELP